MGLKMLKKRDRKKERVRYKLLSVSNRPRLCVYKSNKYIYAQIIDDKNSHTLVSASSLEKDMRDKFKSKLNMKVAEEVGKVIAERALKKDIVEIVFDRSCYPYHGKIKVLADAAREKGLKF